MLPALLKDDGMLIVNLWSTDKNLFAAYCDWLNSAFQERVLFCRSTTMTM